MSLDRLSLLVGAGLLVRSVALAAPTFNRDVAPVLHRHCVRCHRSGEIGPMPLTTYRQARPYAKAMREQLTKGTMPPWFADPHIGKFENDPRLSETERATLLRWVAEGTPEGSGTPPPLPKFTEGWSIGPPEAEFALPHPVKVPPKGAQQNLYFTLPTDFTEDRWVTAMEIRPTNQKVVHHLTVFVMPPQMGRGPKQPGIACTDAFFEEAELKRQRESPDEPARMSRQYLFSWTPGSVPFLARQGGARLIPKGSKLVFEVHYAPSGKPEVDQSHIGMVFAKRPVERRISTLVETNESIVIPAGERNYEASACLLITRDVRLLQLKPHMHLRGHDMRFSLKLPDGQIEPLLFVPAWDFNWQLSYSLAEPRLLPAGARIEIVAHYDNSSGNRANPDPTRTVTWDEQSTGEMLAGMITVDEPIRR